MKYGIFNTLQKLIEKSEDINLMYQFQHDIINYEIQQRRERERMIEEITQKVLSRISTTIDTSKPLIIFLYQDNFSNMLARKSNKTFSKIPLHT